jgi:hypothetical protein
VPVNLVLGCTLLAALALILFTGGVVQGVGYALIVLVALAELAFYRLGSRSDMTFPGENGPWGTGVREPRRPVPTRGGAAAAMPLPESPDEPDDPGAPVLP